MGGAHGNALSKIPCLLNKQLLVFIQIYTPVFCNYATVVPPLLMLLKMVYPLLDNNGGSATAKP